MNQTHDPNRRACRWDRTVLALMIVGSLSLVVTIVFDYLNHMREQRAEQVQRFEQRQLPGLLAMYQLRHNGHLPASLNVIFEESHCPPDVQRELLKRFRYVGAGLNANDLPQDTVLLYELPTPGATQISVIKDFGAWAIPIKNFRSRDIQPGEILIWDGDLVFTKLADVRTTLPATTTPKPSVTQ